MRTMIDATDNRKRLSARGRDPLPTAIPSWLQAALEARQTSRRTRIVCTLGPASEDTETLQRMVDAGMDVARFNFSHGTHEFHRRMAGAVRAAAAAAGRPVSLMQDLQGPKLRIGALAGGSIDLLTGDTVEVRFGAGATATRTVAVPHRELVEALQTRDRVLIGDGEIELQVRARDEHGVVCTVIRGGRLGQRKGISVPGRYFRMPILTRKDRDDLAFGRSLGFDLLALSFVRTAADMEGVRELTRELGWNVPLVAKIETQEALVNLDAILAASDAVMVARGDLGVQLPLAEVPVIQKEIIRRANHQSVPVITATQMLESMVNAGRPTRAEATDVANAVWDGTDAVMLSAETSAGHHPVAAVSAMAELCLAAERNGAWRRGAGPGWPATAVATASMGERI